MNVTQLNLFEEHPLKSQIDYYNIKQYDLATSLQISQSSLSKMLAGIEPMKEIIEDEIESILKYIDAKKQPKKIRNRIIKRT